MNALNNYVDKLNHSYTDFDHGHGVVCHSETLNKHNKKIRDAFGWKPKISLPEWIEQNIVWQLR